MWNFHPDFLLTVHNPTRRSFRSGKHEVCIVKLQCMHCKSIHVLRSMHTKYRLDIVDYVQLRGKRNFLFVYLSFRINFIDTQSSLPHKYFLFCIIRVSQIKGTVSQNCLPLVFYIKFKIDSPVAWKLPVGGGVGKRCWIPYIHWGVVTLRWRISRPAILLCQRLVTAFNGTIIHSTVLLFIPCWRHFTILYFSDWLQRCKHTGELLWGSLQA